MSGLRKYRGRLSYLPVEDSDPPKTQHSGMVDHLHSHSQVHTDCCSPASSSELVGSANLGTPGWTDLPALSSAVPADWVVVEDDFVLVLAVYLSHIASDMLVAPKSRLNDGIIYLTLVRAPITRLHLVKLYSAMQEGTAASDPRAEVIRVRAFRLEPLDRRQGVLMVDGEMVDYGPIQAQVLPSMARVMSLDTRD